MRNVKALGKFALVPGFVLVAAAIGSVAEAAPPGNPNASLRGSYAFTTARTCTVIRQIAPTDVFRLDPSGEQVIIPPPGAPPAGLTAGALFRQSSSDAGIIVFNGDGTATSTGTSRTMSISATSGTAITVSDVSSNINYMVNPDGTVGTTATSRFQRVFPTLGVPGTVTGQTGRLQIGHGKNVLVSAASGTPTSGTPTLETLTFDASDPPVPVETRYCVRSTTMTKLGGN